MRFAKDGHTLGGKLVAGQEALCLWIFHVENGFLVTTVFRGKNEGYVA